MVPAFSGGGEVVGGGVGWPALLRCEPWQWVGSEGWHTTGRKNLHEFDKGSKRNDFKCSTYQHFKFARAKYGVSRMPWGASK